MRCLSYLSLKPQPPCSTYYDELRALAELSPFAEKVLGEHLAKIAREGAAK